MLCKVELLQLKNLREINNRLALNRYALGVCQEVNGKAESALASTDLHEIVNGKLLGLEMLQNQVSLP